MKYAIALLAISVTCLTSMSAVADGVKLRGETFCFPAEDVPKLVSKLAEVKQKRRDIIDVRLNPRFIIKDGGVWPERFYLSKAGEKDTELPFSRETGDVPTFLEATIARPESDICIEDPTRATREEGDEGLYFEMGLSPLFKVSTGQHSIPDLKKAAKDGKKFYKAMLPGWAALLMPDADYFAIRMKDLTAVPTAFASSGDLETALEIERVKDMWVVSLDDMTALTATDLIVRGGDYNLQPVPSPKNLRRFGWGEKNEE